MTKRNVILILSILFSAVSYAQEQEPKTIRVKRESDLKKAVFDNTENKLVLIDRFGNPRENRVLGYKLYVKAKKDTREFGGFNNYLTAEMIAYLRKQSRACKLFFTQIIAEDRDGHTVPLPDVIETWFPDCRNCEKQ